LWLDAANARESVAGPRYDDRRGDRQRTQEDANAQQVHLAKHETAQARSYAGREEAPAAGRESGKRRSH
jgi:hypothetical protein